MTTTAPKKQHRGAGGVSKKPPPPKYLTTPKATGDPPAKAALTIAPIAALVSSFLDRKERCLTLPLVVSWVVLDTAAGADSWRSLFEVHWPSEWVQEAASAVAAGGGAVTWKSEYKRRHEATKGKVVEPTNTHLCFERMPGQDCEAWYEMQFANGRMTGTHGELILVNRSIFKYRDTCLDPDGGEAAGDVCALKKKDGFEVYGAGKGYFTIAEILRIILLRGEDDFARQEREAECALDYCSDDSDCQPDFDFDYIDPYPGYLYEGLKPVWEALS